MSNRSASRDLLSALSACCHGKTKEHPFIVLLDVQFGAQPPSFVQFQAICFLFQKIDINDALIAAEASWSVTPQ